MRQSWTVSIFWTGNWKLNSASGLYKVVSGEIKSRWNLRGSSRDSLTGGCAGCGVGFNYLIINPNQLDRDFNFPWTMLLPNCVRAVLGQILFLVGYQIWSTVWPWYASYWFSDQEERNDKCRNVRKKYRKILPTIWKCNDTFLFLRDIGRGFVRL